MDGLPSILGSVSEKVQQNKYLAAGLGIGALVFLASSFARRKQNDYRGKVVLITGASSGIGEALAYRYASLGATLVIAARRLDRLESCAKKCREAGVEVLVIVADVTKESDCENLIDTAIEKFKRIDILILNAGRGSGFKFSEITSLQQCRDIIDVNYYGYIYSVFFALPHLRVNRSSIVVISSLSGLIPTPRRTTYAASKAAVNAFFRALRMEEPELQISIINPGFVETEVIEKSQKRRVIKDRSKYMHVDECARIVETSAHRGTREVIMTFLGKFGYYVRPFFPNMIDGIAVKVANEI